MQKSEKIGRTITAIVFILVAIFCFATLTVNFTIWFLIVGVIALGFAGFSLKKAYMNAGSGRKDGNKNNDDFEL